MAVIRFFLSGVCHQIPERSLYFQGRPLPLCARCTGTFLGVAAVFLVLWALGEGRKAELPTPRAALTLAVGVALWAIDGFNSAAALALGDAPLYAPQNAYRLATGMAFGLALGSLLYPLFQSAMWERLDPGRVLQRGGVLAALPAVGAALVALILGWDGAPHALWATAVTAAAVWALTATNALLVVLVLRREGLARRAADLVPAMAAGLTLAAIETGGIALLRRTLLGF